MNLKRKNEVASESTMKLDYITQYAINYYRKESHFLFLPVYTRMEQLASLRLFIYYITNGTYYGWNMCRMLQ